MTYDQLIDEAFARVRGAGRHLPRRTLLRRMGQFQSELFQRCARWNPDYYGICVTATLNAGGLDLNALVPALQQVGTITRIQVSASGGAVPAGTRISVVPLEDITSGLAPRATIRDNAFRQVGAELAGVTSIEIHYSRLPNPVLPENGGVEADLREPWQEMLVLDCAMFVAGNLEAEGTAVPAGLVKMVGDELLALAAGYELHVRGYIAEGEDRFRRTGGAG